jgi:hypothetical protein
MTQGSHVAPDFFFPNVYIAWPDNMGPQDGEAHIGMARRRLAEMPVPAVNIRRATSQAFRNPTNIGGRSQVGQPRAFQRFPFRNNSARRNP